MKKLLLLLLLTLLTFDYAAADNSFTIDRTEKITINGITYRQEGTHATVIAIDDSILNSEIIIPSYIKIDKYFDIDITKVGANLLKNKTFNKIIFESSPLLIANDAFVNASGNIFFNKITTYINTDSPFNNFNGMIQFSNNRINASELYSIFKQCIAPNLTLMVSAEICEKFKSYFEDKPSFKIDQIEEVAIVDVHNELDILTFNVTCRSDIDATKLDVTVDEVPAKKYDGVYKIEGLMIDQTHNIEVAYNNPDHRRVTINKKYKIWPPFVFSQDDEISHQGKLELSWRIYYDSPTPEVLFSYNSGYNFYYYKENENSYHKAILENTDSKDTRIIKGAINNLIPNTKYNDISIVIKKGDKIIYRFKLGARTTAELNCDYEYKSTQTTITLSKIELLLDGTYNPGEIEYFNDNIKINSFPYKLTGLKPDDSRGFSVKTKDGKELCQFSINTLSLEAYPTNTWSSYDSSEGRYRYGSSSQPTTYIFKPYAGENDCDIESYHFYGGLFGNKMVTCKPGEQLVATGLKPGGKNRFEFWVTLKNDNSSKEYCYSKNYIYTTDLKIETLQPRNVSATSSIVCAETNISDRETNVGFQWRKYDAPESLKSSEGYAAIYDGLMEGRINKLQSTSYYKVRAFYKSNSGEYYYGDWVTFDPSDFSYFEPTVHTYNIDYVTYNSAEVRGYVMAGSDEIIRQGFEYSATTSQAAPKRKYIAATQNPTIILATGQVMTATLTDLEPSTTYVIRAFAETASGIVYGDEQVFTTDAFSGISDTIADKDGRTPTAYYDLSGRRYDKPQHGVNIVVYDDGTAEKMLLKQQ